ncbi:MAG: glycosyltransferase [Candidatus Limnocylindrales bacterium]
MRIAVVAPLFAPLRPAQPYGPHAFLLDLARELDARGHAVAVYCAAGSAIPGVRLREVPVDPILRLSQAVTAAPEAGSGGRQAEPAAEVVAAAREAFGRVYAAIEADGAEVVSQHAFDAEALELAGSVPVLHTLHLAPILARVVRAAALSRAPLAVVSEAARRDWEAAGVPIAHVLRNGVRAWDPGHPAIEPVALLAGRISPEKGTAAGIRAALRAGLRPRVVGEPYDRAYFEAEVVPLLDRVDLVPTLPREALWREMARAAVTLMPIAGEEQFGLVAAEAQMAGCPLVGYRRGALPEVVEAGVSGFLVEPGDEDVLVDAIERARALPREAILASARRRLGLDAAVDGYEQVLGALAVGQGVGDGDGDRSR